MDELRELYLTEIEDFCELGRRFLSGEVTKADFKKHSGGMGVYSHRNGKELMVRLRTPSGIISHDDMKHIYGFASRYALPSVHLTTRQAVQLHGLGIEEIRDIMIESLDYGIYTRGSGGNFPRNTAVSPLAGVQKGEAFDVSPYALAVHDHLMKRMHLFHLPRKIKFSFSGDLEDTSHATVADMGFYAVINGGKRCFRMFIGGGLGRSPQVAATYTKLVCHEDVLFHVNAVISMFEKYGDYENKGRARLRYVLQRLGEDEFLKAYEAELDEAMKDRSLRLEIDGSAKTKEGRVTGLIHKRLCPQKTDGLYSVYFHPVGGQLDTGVMKSLIDFAEGVDDVEYRLTMGEGLFIRNLRGDEAEELIRLTEGFGGETDVEQSVACIGVPTCQLGVLNTQGAMKGVISALRDAGMTKDILPKLYFSGCPNSCGTHMLGDIGFTGKARRIGDESVSMFEVHMGAVLGIGTTRLGVHMGDIREESVPDFIKSMYREIDESGISYADLLRDEARVRSMLEPFIV